MKKLFVITSLGVIMLGMNGCIPAAIIATEEVGTSVAEERSLGNIVDDATIMAKVKNEFAQRDVANLLSKISVSVKEGRVLLTGSVPKYEYAIKAVEAVWVVEGVREVINELDVAEKDIKTRASDSWIAAKVRTKLILQKGVSSVNYTVDVNRGVIYLIGIAKDEHELQLATQVAGEIEGVQEVVSHVTLKSDPRRQRRSLK